MATSQYIGARYVPLFAEPAQWDKTKQYEPLTIVLDHGNSYTSRQFVPVGIELTNDAFWALTGNYNAQVEQYRQEVTAYDDRITTAQTTADGAATKATEADTKATNANAAIAAEVTRATGKEAEIQSLAETNETDIAQLDAQMAATSPSELLNRINKEVSDRTAAVSGIETSLGTRIDTEKSERVSADASLGVRIDSQKSELESLITSKFPIGTDSILDGSVTATKLAQSAISAILNGAVIKFFDSENGNADNTGLVCPSGFKVSGCYIDALKLLIINKCESRGVDWSGVGSEGGKVGITLPSYVPRIATTQRVTNFGILRWTDSQYFKSWEWLLISQDGYMGPGVDIPSSDNTCTVGTNVFCLAPFIAGETVTNAQYSDYASQNAVI